MKLYCGSSEQTPNKWSFWGIFQPDSLDFFGFGRLVLRTGPPPPLEWPSFPSLVTAVLITHKGAESPDGRRNRCAG